MLEIIKGDITKLDFKVDAMVNPSNTGLILGAGVSGSMREAAGPRLQVAMLKLAPIEMGQAVITPAFELNADYVIHTVPPRYGFYAHPDQLLAEAYRSALNLAVTKQLSSVAIPSLGTGIYAYPLAEAIPIALKVMAEFPKLKIYLVTLNDTTYHAFKKAFEADK